MLVGSLVSLKAQNSNLIFGISSSIDFNSYAFVDDSGPVDYQLKFNYSAGFVLKYAINDRLTATTKALYATKNFEESIDLNSYQTIHPSDLSLLSGNFIIAYKNTYVDIPFELNYRLNPEYKTGMIVCFGVVNSFLIDYSTKMENSFLIEPLKKYNDYLLGVKLGFGLLFDIGQLGLQIEPQIKYYLTEVHNSYPDSNPIHFGIELQILNN